MILFVNKKIMIEIKRTCYFKTYKHLILKSQNPSSILTQTHMRDFQRFHIYLFLKLFFSSQEILGKIK
jgi:hypothetical protein